MALSTRRAFLPGFDILIFIYSPFLRGFEFWNNSFKIMVGAGRFERPTPCAQGSFVASKGSIVFRELLIFTTNRGICFRSISKFTGWNRWDSDTVLAQQKSSGVINPFAIDNFF
jgi:hypothetical protein